ncbi:MAG: YqgE/AlgH family protein [Deltaproteobacteria bacterium]|nr:YqgE/AlgH family protein [Deltaproteobacteria bacterium]
MVLTLPLLPGGNKWHSCEMGLDLSPGFIVASPTLLDPNFRRTVVLLVDHGVEGSLGFVVNRPAAITLSNMVDRLGFTENGSAPPDAPVLIGGPVAPDTGWIIFDQRGFEQAADSSVIVSESVSVSASRAMLESVLRGKGPKRMILALGYSGWGPGQLDDEIARGAWIPADLDSRIVFDTPYDQRWSDTLKTVGIDPARLTVMTPSEA